MSYLIVISASQFLIYVCFLSLLFRNLRSTGIYWEHFGIRWIFIFVWSHEGLKNVFYQLHFTHPMYLLQLNDDEVKDIMSFKDVTLEVLGFEIVPSSNVQSSLIFASFCCWFCMGQALLVCRANISASNSCTSKM